MGVETRQSKRRLKGLRPATGRQLYRLNEQGLLRLAIDADTFVPGGPEESERIDYRDAGTVLDRLRTERWAGLGRFPEPGESFGVKDGLVHSYGIPDDV